MIFSWNTFSSFGKQTFRCEDTSVHVAMCQYPVLNDTNSNTRYRHPRTWYRQCWYLVLGSPSTTEPSVHVDLRLCMYGSLWMWLLLRSTISSKVYANLRLCEKSTLSSSCTGVCLWLSRCHWPNVPGLNVMEVWRTDTPMGTAYNVTVDFVKVAELCWSLWQVRVCEWLPWRGSYWSDTILVTGSLVPRPLEKRPGNFCEFKLLLPLPESWQYQSNFRM